MSIEIQRVVMVARLAILVAGTGKETHTFSN